VIDTRPAPHIRSDLDHRIELVSMDRYCADITVALYLMAGGTSAVVHSYSGWPEVPGRLDWLAATMRRLGGMNGSGRTVGYACGAWHERAARRTFLEACKVDPRRPLPMPPLTVDDPRTNQIFTVASRGGGRYTVSAVAADPAATSRAPAVAAGLAKLADLEPDPDDEVGVRFTCGAPHDELVALLLPRAINVRAALREQELAAGQGLLLAPGTQEGAGA
jgi:hypothetical protein